MEYCSVKVSDNDVIFCKKIVNREMSAANIKLTKKELDLLTKDIMDTSAMMGGGFDEDSIMGVCQTYIDSRFYDRFIKLHRNELMDDEEKINSIIFK